MREFIINDGRLEKYVCDETAPEDEIFQEAVFFPKDMCKDIIIPDSVTVIGKGAFQNCYSVRSIIIPNSVTKIEEEAFSFCVALERITIPNSVTEIGGRTFVKCEDLDHVVIPNSLTRIPNEMFSCCESLNDITIPESVTSIGALAFNCCFDLEQIDLPNSVTSIEDSAFNDSAIENIIIPNGVNRICEYTFCMCSQLKSVTIPESVVFIDKNAFFLCEKLEELNFPEIRIAKRDTAGFSKFVKYIRRYSQLFLHTTEKTKKTLQAFDECLEMFQDSPTIVAYLLEKKNNLFSVQDLLQSRLDALQREVDSI